MVADKKTQIYTDKIAWMAIIVVALVVGLFFYINIQNQDINFSQRVFAGLVKGRHLVQKLIDWGNLKAVGVNVGQTYSNLPNDKERADYRQAFINSFSSGFRQAGGNFKSFVNWRLYNNPDCARDTNNIIVAADYKGKDKTILFTLSQDGRKRLTAIQWGD